MARISAFAGNNNALAFLDAIAHSEIGADLLAASDDGYNVIVGSTAKKPNLFSDYSHHPRIAVQTKYGWSDAAGRYQFMAAIPGKIHTDTWDWSHRIAGVHDFSPVSQDKTCIALIQHHGAWADVLGGHIADAFEKCRTEWASLPGAGYGQHENRMTDLLNVFEVARAKYT